MIDIEVVTLEDGNEYYIAREIKDYVYLVNTKDNSDVCIRKSVKKEDGKTYIETLDSEKELLTAIELFKDE